MKGVHFAYFHDYQFHTYEMLLMLLIYLFQVETY